MALMNISLAEDALSLPPQQRADLAKSLIDRLKGSDRSDAEIKTELARRLACLRSGEDRGYSLDEVFAQGV